jgi:imidazole glycerol-phosphate synthase subunit HisF
MVKKRLIFTLLYRNSKFNLSRNFSLQAVGDLSWLKKHYDLVNNTQYIDELIVLNVDRTATITNDYLNAVKNLVSECFIPVACGGGIKDIDDAYRLLNAGADKVVINTLMTENRNEVRKIIDQFGSQFVVGSIDYNTTVDGPSIFSHCGQKNTNINLEDGVQMYQDIGVGELYLTSINKDGTGQGFDLSMVHIIAGSATVPVIVSGGAGKPEHFEEALNLKGVNAVATANLFNFMCGGIKDARSYLTDRGIYLAKWID